MRPLILKRLTFANIVSFLALFVALSGTAYASAQLAKNSVGTKQLKNNAVTSAKVRNHSLLAADFKAGQLPAGPPGKTGAPGGFTETLPSGKTLRGVYSYAGHKTTGYSPNDSISYQFPLTAAPSLNILDIDAAPTAACPGSPAQPQAAPGNLCVYQTRNDSGTKLDVFVADAGGTLGAILFADVPEDTNFEFDGSWAVTAP